MEILLAFAPFILFVVVERLFGPAAGLVTGTVASCALLVRGWLSRGKTVKVLEIGTAILFGGLAVYTLMTGAAWPIAGVRLRVDAGLLLVVLVSIAIRRPFTLQYAREQTPQEVWNTPEFVHTNYVITAAWAAAFAVMVGADLVLLYLPKLPSQIGIGATIAAIWGAIRFTSWYADRAQPKSAQV
jgi:hypothetical protein